jgi:V8-like Glu-specific endopeptidase
MKEKIFGAVLLFWALFFILPGYVATAQEDDNDYVMVDMKTGEEQIIDLSSGQYSNAEKFVSHPLFPNQNEEKAITDFDSKDPGISTHSIIGNDDRWKVTNTNQYPYTTIARLTVTYQDGTTACGTGAMINARLLATVGHVLINSNGAHLKSVRMQFGQNGNYVYYDTSDFKSYIYRGGYETDQSIEGDYGFIVFKDNTVSKYTGHMGIVTVPSESDTLYTAGYPGDKGYYYMYAVTGSIVNMGNDLIYHNMDTMGGQSGSPVYIIGTDGYPYLVAMHSSGGGTVNAARRLEPGLFYWLRDNGYLG